MDITSIIEKKIRALAGSEAEQGMLAVLRHIKVAEEHFERAVETDVEHLFNDVVYRTNQAFEGGLKEAFFVLGKNKSKHVKPHEIEQYFDKNGVFNKRVLNLFQDYRKNWRNETTHDYAIEITEEEAFLAISSVSAFVSILISQIIQELSARNESIPTAKVSKESVTKIGLLTSLENEFMSLSTWLLTQYGLDQLKQMNEAQIVGFAQGFLRNAFPGAKIKIDEKIAIHGESRHLVFRPDMIVELNGEQVLVEFKSRYSRGSMTPAIHQVISYLKATSLNQAILYYPPDSEMVTKEIVALGTSPDPIEIRTIR